MKEQAAICLAAGPKILGRYPDWLTFEQKWLCGNYTPQLTAYRSHLDEWEFVYNREKPFIDICIGIGTAVTIIGVPGKLVSLQFTNESANFCFVLSLMV